MDLRPPFAVALAAAACGRADLSLPAPEWWSPPVPFLDAAARPDLGLPGQPESAPPVSDQAVRGGAYTRAFFRHAPQQARTDSVEWARRSSRFGLETVAAVPGGLALGLDAVDNQVVHRFDDSRSARWELARPRGGLRLGAGANVLEQVVRDHEWVWGWSVWAPLLDRTGELEVQTGLRRSRLWRVDLAWATRRVRQEARRIDAGWDEGADTTTLRGTETRWSARAGGQTASGASLQAWGGWRRVEDGRDDDDARSVGLASDGFFAGFQGSTGGRAWTLAGEGRFDQGADTLRLGVGDPVLSRVDHRLAAGSLVLQAPWSGAFRPSVELAGSWLDLDDGRGRGAFPQLPAGLPVDGGGSVLRLGGALAARVRTPWVELTPRLGLHRLRTEGDLPATWTGLWPLPAGGVWVGEVGAGIARLGPSGSASYTLGWFAPLATVRGAQASPSHRLDLRQDF